MFKVQKSFHKVRCGLFSILKFDGYLKKKTTTTKQQKTCEREVSLLSVHLAIKTPYFDLEQQFKICWYKSFNTNSPAPEEIWAKWTCRPLK